MSLIEYNVPMIQDCAQQIAACKTLTAEELTQFLKDKLNRRNMAAHPSRVTFNQHQADDMITDFNARVAAG